MYLYGPDGSGKTVLSNLLAGVLAGRGVPVRLFWMRGTHTFASILARLLRRFGAFSGSDNPFYSFRVPPRLRPLWVYVEFLSILPILARYLVASSLGVVVSDRFLPDFVVWVSLTSRNPRFLSSPLATLLLGATRRLGCGVYVTADVDTLCARRSDMPCGFTVLEKRIYDAIAAHLSTPIVDTSHSSVTESFREVLKHAERCLNELQA